MVASPDRYFYCSAHRGEARENRSPAAEAGSSGCVFGTGKPVPFGSQPCIRERAHPHTPGDLLVIG